MSVVYGGRWSRGMILDQALKKVGNEKIRGLAREQLNRILEDLYVQFEWPWLYRIMTVALGSTGTFTVPSDFLKTQTNDTGLRIVNLDGSPVDYPVYELDPADFFRRAIPQVQEGQRALIYWVDYGLGVITYWPQPNVTCTAQFVYKYLPADVSTADPAAYDADIPLFPYGRLLQLAVEAWAYQYEHDSLGSQMSAQALAIGLDAVRNIALPRKSEADTLSLDEETFRRRPFHAGDLSGGGRWR